MDFLHSQYEEKWSEGSIVWSKLSKTPAAGGEWIFHAVPLIAIFRIVLTTARSVKQTERTQHRRASRAGPRLASGAPVSVLTSPRVLPGGPRADLRGRRWLSRVRLCDPPGPSLRGILQATSLQRAACPPPEHLPSAGGARVFRVPGPSRRVPDRERPLGSCPPAERTANVLRAVCNSGFHVPTLHLLLNASN